MRDDREFCVELVVGDAGQARFNAKYIGQLIDISKEFKGDFIIKSTGEKIELKTDMQGHRTGNLFVELDMTTEGQKRRPGAAYQAIKHGCKYMVYQTEDGLEFWFDPTALKNRTELFRRTHGELYRRVDNVDRETGRAYWSGGLKMPKAELTDLYLPIPLRRSDGK